jgi:ABC-type bacteriocin/lantibiotic exporter with double-glycine peptidase domain
MGRTKIIPFEQPNDYTCGPSTWKMALSILGIRKSFLFLNKLCKTNSSGTSTKNMIKVANKLGLSVLMVRKTNLRQLKSALKIKSPKNSRAVVVDYLYDLDKNKKPDPKSGHWATVSSYKSKVKRIQLLDSASGTKKSYRWFDFYKRWFDYDLKRRYINVKKTKYKMIKNWQPKLMLVIAKNPLDLPKFKSPQVKLYLPV